MNEWNVAVSSASTGAPLAPDRKNEPAEYGRAPPATDGPPSGPGGLVDDVGVGVGVGDGDVGVGVEVGVEVGSPGRPVESGNQPCTSATRCVVPELL